MKRSEQTNYLAIGLHVAHWLHNAARRGLLPQKIYSLNCLIFLFYGDQSNIFGFDFILIQHICNRKYMFDTTARNQPGKARRSYPSRHMCVYIRMCVCVCMFAKCRGEVAHNLREDVWHVNVHIIVTSDLYNCRLRFALDIEYTYRFVFTEVASHCHVPQRFAQPIRYKPFKHAFRHRCIICGAQINTNHTHGSIMSLIRSQRKSQTHQFGSIQCHRVGGILLHPLKLRAPLGVAQVLPRFCA